MRLYNKNSSKPTFCQELLNKQHGLDETNMVAFFDRLIDKYQAINNQELTHSPQ